MHLKHTTSLLLAAAIVFATTSISQAVDIIKRKDAAARLGGKISKVTKTAVTIEVSGKPETVPVNEIEKITWDGQPPLLDGHKDAEAAGRYANALAGYEKIRKMGTLSERVKADLEYFITRVKAKQSFGDSSKQPAAIAALESFQTKNPDSHHYYEAQGLLADLYLATKSFDKAKTALAELKKAPWKDVQIGAQNSEARVLLAQGNAAKALAAYNSVIASSTGDTSMRAMRNQATLGKAACLKETSKYNESLKVLKDVIASAQLGESAVLAEAYLLRGDNYLALGKNKDALIAYLHVDVLFARESKFHPQALKQLAGLWAKVGHPARAKKAARDLETLYGSSK